MKQMINRHWIKLTSGIFLVYCLLLSLQGIGLSDDGYSLVAFQNFFKDHTYANYFNGMYFTGLLGGIWEKLFGWGGYYSFRVLNCLVIVGGYIIVCHTLREYWRHKWWIFAGFALVILNMLASHNVMVFHYDTLSALINCVAALLLYRSFRDNNNRLLFLSSILLGVNIFVRLPNLMLCVIPFTLSCIVYFYDRNVNAFYRQILAIIGGGLIGVVVVLAILFSLGHIESYFVSLGEYSRIAQNNSQGSHGIITMLKTYSEQYCYVLLYMVVLVAFIGGLYVTSRISFFKRNRRIYYLLVVIAVCVLSGFLYLFPISLRPRIILLFAFAYVIDLFIIVKKWKNKNLVVLMAIFILISFFQVYGSDHGIYSMGPYSIWGIIPASMVIVINILSDSRSDGIFHKSCTISIGTLVVFLTFLLMRYNQIHCYEDAGPRSSKTFKIESLSRANVFTNKERAEEMDSIMAVCNQYIVEGDTTLFTLDIPVLHYLTNTKPYLKNPWPNTAPIGKLDKMFESVKENSLPKLIVRRRIMNLSGITEIERRYQYNDKLVEEFTLTNHYKTVWSNENFIVYVK